MARSDSPDTPLPSEASPPSPPRRNFFIEGAAVVIGAVISLFPLGAGLAVLLDPVLRNRKKEESEPGSDEFVRVTNLESVPAAGAQQYPVIADRQDAWTNYPNQRIGAVYLRRTAEKQVECFNAVCPHLGCIYSYVASRNEFYCPCHNSAFHLDGSKVEATGRVNPSPRPLDQLEVDQKRLEEKGEVWVKFQNFYTGIEEKIPKP
jgi:menaquinol-cytochrome c reductase iron-sulfur subunit